MEPEGPHDCSESRKKNTSLTQSLADVGFSGRRCIQSTSQEQCRMSTMIDHFNPGIKVKALCPEQGLKEGEVYRILAVERHPSVLDNKVVYTLEKDGRHFLVLHKEGILEEIFFP